MPKFCNDKSQPTVTGCSVLSLLSATALLTQFVARCPRGHSNRWTASASLGITMWSFGGQRCCLTMRDRARRASIPTGSVRDSQKPTRSPMERNWVSPASPSSRVTRSDGRETAASASKCQAGRRGVGGLPHGAGRAGAAVRVGPGVPGLEFLGLAPQVNGIERVLGLNTTRLGPATTRSINCSWAAFSLLRGSARWRMIVLADGLRSKSTISLRQPAGFSTAMRVTASGLQPRASATSCGNAIRRLLWRWVLLTMKVQ